jgi:2-polyprenyl-3-methyl-5-hydroxy-6-metoxy-1,4-benzoquinol methylase
MAAEDERVALYRNYASWKTWEGATVERADAGQYDDIFAIECRRAGLPANASVLELGFGNGEFLDWCRMARHRVCGVELIPELVERARAKGHETVLCDGSPPRLAGEQMFDLIAAFDVFEHLTVDELRTWLGWMGAHLRPEGRIVARFPNGGSPFGRLYQSGDLTHRLTLSATSVDQLARLAGLRLVAAHNAARPLGGGRSKIAKRLAYAVRDVVEIAVGYVYFSRRVPLDPSMTVVLARIVGAGPR